MTAILENAVGDPTLDAVSEPTLDFDAVREHFEQYRGAPGLLCVWSLPEKRSHVFETDADGIARAVETVRDLDTQGETSIYVQGTTLERLVLAYQRGSNDNVAAWLGVQFDVDYGKELSQADRARDPRPYAPDLDTVLALLDKAELPPRTDTQASGHGVYPVWRLAAPVPDGAAVRALVVDMEAELRRVFNEAGYRLDASLGKDAARVWRVPGTVNRKVADEPVQARVLSDGGPRYEVQALRGGTPASGGQPEPADAGDGGLENAAGRDGTFTDEQAKAYVQRQAWDRLRDSQHGTDVNTSLNEASYVVGHFVRDWFGGDSRAAADRIAEQYRELVCSRYGWPDLDSADTATLRSGLNKGVNEPYTRRRETPADEVFGEDTRTPEERDAQALADAVRKERIRVQAREIVAAERLPAAPPLDEIVVWDDNLESIPPPEMAVPELIPERAVGWLGGPSGSYKSFVGVSLGLALAYEVPALDSEAFTPRRGHKVLYVAGEGSSGVALRSRAMRRRAGITRSGRFGIYPYALDLGSAREVERLAAFVLKHEIDYIVVDTWRQSTPGVNEIDNTDVGVILRRLLALRDEHGISSLLLDHTNKSAGVLADLGGAGAKRANADYVLMIDLPNGSRDASQQRTLRVAKFKDAPDGRSWPIRLQPVPEVVDAEGRPSAVAVIGSAGLAEAPNATPEVVANWATVVVPEKINDRLDRKTGANAARDVYRVLAKVDDPDGLTQSVIQKVIEEGCKERGVKMHGRSTWQAGFALAKRQNVIGEGSTASRWVLLEPPAKLENSQ